MKQAIGLFYKYNSKWNFVFRLFLGILNSVSGVFTSIIVPSAIANYFADESNTRELFVCLLIGVVSTLLFVTGSHLFNCFSEPITVARFEGGIYTSLFTKMNQLPLKYYDDNKFYEKFILAVSNVREAVYGFIGLWNEFVSLFFSIAFSTLVLVLVDAKILIVMGVCLVVTGVVQVVMALMLIKVEKEGARLKNIFEYIERLFYLKEYAIEMRTSRISRVMLGVFEKNMKDAERWIAKIMKKGMVGGFVDSGISNILMYFTILIYACYRIAVVGEYTVGELIAMVTGSFALYSFLGQLISLLSRSFELSERYKIFREFMKLGDLSGNDSENGALETIPIEKYKNLTFRQVSFGYEEKNVIKDLDIDIPLGSVLAILGPNGAGKSTFLKLLMGYYQPVTGEIALDDCDISKYSNSAYRGLFSCVTQKPVLFEMSIVENVLLRKCDSEEDREAVAEVLKKVGLWDKVQSLPNGMDSIIGKEFTEEGVLFSGGEAQRIAIARAMLQNNPIIILDEPSSHLDPRAEYELFQLMCNLKKNNTTIFVTHNIRNVKDADLIIWLEDGKIAEKGSHLELMALKGKYYNAYRSRYNILQEREDERGQSIN